MEIVSNHDIIPHFRANICDCILPRACLAKLYLIFYILSCVVSMQGDAWNSALYICGNMPVLCLHISIQHEYVFT